MDGSDSVRLLSVEGLRRRIKKKEILRGVDLDVSEGEVVGLLGPNGAGKTTTFRLIAGLDQCTQGRVLLRGRDLVGEPLHLRVRAGLGYLPQEPSIFRTLSTIENIAMALEVSGERNIREKSAKVLEEFGLDSLAEQKAGTLSGGERRRLEVARAVSLDPQILICDEPLTGVDPKAASELREILRNLARRGIGVLLTDHNVAEALPACDRAFLLVDGKIVEKGTAKDLVSSESARSLYFGDLFARPGKWLREQDGAV